MVETWKDIPGYVGDYQVSSLGRVKSLKYGKERILRQEKLTGGYMYAFLCRNNKKKNFRVHRLVAMAFLENKKNLPEVNHINGDQADNSLDNLEWCGSKYNHTYPIRRHRISKAKGKPVFMIDPESGLILKRFESSRIAQKETRLSESNINQCCRGERKTAGGFLWKREVLNG